MVEKLDVRGLFCPVPITMVSRKLKNMPIGAKLEITADGKGFAKDLRAWCLETGNTLQEMQQQDAILTARIQRGAGFHGESVLEKIKFILLGIRVHFTKILCYLLIPAKPQFLITFVSIAEGLRSHRFLKDQNFSGYRLLPVPDEIYPHCGLVFGFTRKEAAVELFGVLREANFAAEEIRWVDSKKTYPTVAMNDASM